MTNTALKRRVLPIGFAALAAGGALTSSPALAATSITYKGATYSNRWGTAQVSIVVKNKKITNVKASVSDHTSRSQFIVDQALPLLKQEVLQAQSASVDTISGATDISQAYIASLQSAVKKAIKARALTTRAL
jgi:uncharacterized protein with FMN-binding domain